MAERYLEELTKLLKKPAGLPYEGNGIAERAIDDLDTRKFISYFLSPYEPKDSLEYMAKELLTLKRGKELQTYREVVQELMNRPDLRQTIEEFVVDCYNLKSRLDKRSEIGGIFGIDRALSYMSREKIREFVRTDYQVLKFYCSSVEKTQEFESESTLLRGLKAFGLNATQSEYYQTTRKVIEMMENFGKSQLRVDYDWFDKLKDVTFSPHERKLSEVLGSALKKMVPHFYFFTTRGERFYANALEFLIDKQPSIEEIPKHRKKMDFFLGATRYVEKLKSEGMPFTFPTFSEKDGILIKELYNPCLLLQGMKKENIVPNDVESSPEQNVAIITGPNNTGKSVYVKSIGLAYALAQNGFPITARGAQLSELDGIYTHFVHPEDITLGEGSYLDELRRVKDMFQNATPRSLIIVDEPIRGSSPEDAKEMSLRFIKGFIKLKAPTFLTTHLHGVAGEADGWKAVKNLQTGMEVDGKELKPTYKIKSGKAGKSYGIEIADKFGLTEEEIQRMLEEKNKS